MATTLTEFKTSCHEGVKVIIEERQSQDGLWEILYVSFSCRGHSFGETIDGPLDNNLWFWICQMADTKAREWLKEEIDVIEHERRHN